MKFLIILSSIWLFLSFKFCFAKENSNLFDASSLAECFKENESVVASSMIEIEPVSKLLVASCQKLGLKLFKTLSSFEIKSDSNGLIFSPSSIWSSLIITYLGSKGDTENELKNRLQLDNLSKTSIALAYRSIKLWQNLKLVNSTKTKTSKTKLSDVNKIFVADNLKVNTCFKDLFDKYIETKDFINHPTESLLSINQWVKNQTEGEINIFNLYNIYLFIYFYKFQEKLLIYYLVER